MAMFLSRKIGADRYGAVDFETGTLAFGEIVFTVFGAADIEEACLFAISRIGAPEDVGVGGIPDENAGSPCLGINQASIDDAGNVDVYMNYRSPTATGGGGGGDVVSFSTGGGTTQIVSGYSHTTYGTPRTGYDGAIGITASGDVNGVDIDIATFDFTVERFYTAAQMTDSFVGLIRGLSNHVNSVEIFGAAAGEIRFLCADGVKSSEDNRIAFKFRFSQNETGLGFGAVTGVSKNGHQYLDVYCEGIPPKAKAVTVHTVYLNADLRALGFN